MALSEPGYGNVIARDETLFNASRSSSQDQSIKAVVADLRDRGGHGGEGAADAMVCMGDTITHCDDCDLGQSLEQAAVFADGSDRLVHRRDGSSSWSRPNGVGKRACHSVSAVGVPRGSHRHPRCEHGLTAAIWIAPVRAPEYHLAMSPYVTTSLSPIPAGWQALHHAILADGTLAAIVTDVDLASEWARIHASPDGHLDPPGRIDDLTKEGSAKLLSWGEDGWKEGPVFPLETPHPLLGRFADGRWLVVGSRTRGDPNARILSPDGSLLTRFMLGDGIEHVAIDDLDRIWVGWFDEGIFGRGWSVPGMEWPPSSNGVACFTPDGSIVAVPTWPEEAGLIDDCYALTPAASGAWVCAYTDFALVNFAPGEPTRWWRNALVGAKAIAIDGNHMLLAGGYGSDAARLALVELDQRGSGEAAVTLATWQMPLRLAGSERPMLLTGRADTLHLIDGDRWHRWRVGDVVTALAYP